ncbi:RNA polymerase sigma factor [Cytobacillus firmus]|uniref:RNA polymerase sigma factor n=2 Tax=Cytobacillus firmus TaxID=1399 RepID=A0A380XTQ3_CYTFI|nr:RNA polymerase sigma factor [Cytobacillus firmus]KAF0824542.1 RNA polymerase sigma-70 factor [Cytobacillus firmus]MDD9311558.1 RNA polymerase sigma factor [Cytobacillus firmus]MEC1895066.1 RNA polymerase sigma factor [Cytobacillus firmus]MED1906383.1 RNA polymerase sigma factor [Cytobacillus firmus]MED1941777.1 RNA polymerase sigma factor [Cytobacillus firmus]
MIKPSMDMREICRLYNKRLYHIAYSITRDHYLAQDVVQETLIKAYKKMDSIDDQDKLGAWLSSIATRTAIDFVRKERRTNERIQDSVDFENCMESRYSDTGQEAEINMLQEQIYAYVDSLSYEQKRVFLLKTKHGLKEREIADILHLNPNTVKTKLYRVRQQLREILADRNLA